MDTINTTSLQSSTRLKIRVTSGGLHIFNRATGTNVLIDEVRPSLDLVATAPRQVSIALTNACDLACEYCYAPKNPAVLAFKPLSSWLCELDENGCIGIGFGGGEPTLYPNLAELCAFTTTETNLAVTLTTHAHRLTEKLLKELAGNINFVRVSMDGVGCTYELNRQRSFDELVVRIKSLRSITPFGINFVVNSDTIEDLDQAVELAAELGASEFLLLPERPTPVRQGIDQDTTQRLKVWVNSYRGVMPLAVSESDANGLPTCNPLWFETGLTAFAHIDATGILKRTSFDVAGVKIGDRGVLKALHSLKQINEN